MKKLFVYLKAYRRQAVLAPVFKLAEACFDLCVPLVVAAMIDRGIGGENQRLLLSYGALLVGLGLLGLVFSITAQWFAAQASVGFSADIRRDLYKKIMDMSATKLEEKGAATLLTRLTSDVNQVQAGMNLALRLLLRSPFIVFGAMVMAFFIDFKAALVFLVTIGLLLLFTFGVLLLAIPRYQRVQEFLDALTLHTRESLSGVRVIRGFVSEKKETEDFRRKNRGLTAAQNQAGELTALLNPGTFVLLNLGLVVLIYVGALRVEVGILSQGQVVALVNYMSQILVELIKLANLILSITKAIACGRRISQVLEEEEPAQPEGELKQLSEEPCDSMAQGKESSGIEKNSPALNVGDLASEIPFLEFRHVSFTYPSSQEESLSDISFSAKKGETLGIIGGTGSGKSTLVQLMEGRYPLTEGDIFLEGKSVFQMDASERKKRLAYVPQQAVLFSGSLRDNLLWGKEEATEEELTEALRRAQAQDFVQEKEGLDTPVFQGGRNFSGGQRQRLTIARALVRKGDILILDDSTSALDYATEAALREALGEDEENRLTILVSQRTSGVRQADQILVLEDGALVGKGTHETLLETCDVYKEIYHSQYGKGVQPS